MKNDANLKLKPGILVLAGLMISVSIFGQVNFSGNWAFNETKSNIGEGGARMVSRKIIISQSDNTFTLERYFTDRQGEERKMIETYTLDGQESINTIYNTEKKSTATWSDDKKSLTVSSQMVFEMNGQQNEIKSVEVYSLSDGDKILTINSQSTSSMGERKLTLVYDKR
jgi:Tol biopolymer transport system component